MRRYKNTLILGVDPGNFNIKTQTQCFTSGYVEVSGPDEDYTDIIEYDGRYYALCSTRVAQRDDKTEDDTFKILALFAMAKELTQHKVMNGAHTVNLSVGLPPAHMRIAGLKDRTKSYYTGEYDFTYNGRKYHLNVEKVYVCPQGIAAIMSNCMTAEMKRLSGDNMLLGHTRPIDILEAEPLAVFIDIGGGTVDAGILHKGIIQPFKLDKPPAGIIHTYEEVSSQIKAKWNKDTSEATINMLLNGENIRISKEEIELVNNMMGQYSRNLLLQLREKALPFDNSYTLLIGGGSKIVMSHWGGRAKFAMLDYIEDIRANADGNEVMAFAAMMRSGA